MKLVHAFKRREEAEPREPGSGVITEVAGSVVHEGTLVLAFLGWRAAIDHFSVVDRTLG